MSKFKIKHIRNLLVRFITRDKYYVCEECHHIHKRDGKELRLDKPADGVKLLSHPLWHGSVNPDCYNKLMKHVGRSIRESILSEESAYSKLQSEKWANNVKVKAVRSATSLYLISGIIYAILIILLEFLIVISFFAAPVIEAVVLGILLHIPIGFLLLVSITTIKGWKERKQFNLYYCNLNSEIDIDYIKENFSIEIIDENGVLFVEKKDSVNYTTWSLLQGYSNMYTLKKKLFS